MEAIGFLLNSRIYNGLSWAWYGYPLAMLEQNATGKGESQSKNVILGGVTK